MKTTTPPGTSLRVVSTLVLAPAMALVLVGCGDDDGPAAPAAGGGDDLTWSFEGLEPLGSGFVYEGWVIVDGAPVSVGRFDVATDGTPSLTGADLTAAERAGAEAFVLTIEPGAGDDPAPSATKLLGGDFAGGAASLSVDHPAALGTSFASAAGPYILETPTTASTPGDHDQGIWWLDPMAGPGPTLTLPSLPSGWAYEGWVVVGGTPISTGRFESASGVDSDGAGPTSGPDGAPPFPGQDFIDPPVVLPGGAAVVSVEPEPDDSPAPFVLKPLVDPTIEDVGAGVLQSMTNQAAATNPAGVATLQ